MYAGVDRANRAVEAVNQVEEETETPYTGSAYKKNPDSLTAKVWKGLEQRFDREKNNQIWA